MRVYKQINYRYIRRALAPDSVSHERLSAIFYSIPIDYRRPIGIADSMSECVPMEPAPEIELGIGSAGTGNVQHPNFFSRDNISQVRELGNRVRTAPIRAITCLPPETGRPYIYTTPYRWVTVAENETVVDKSLYKRIVAGQKEARVKLPPWRYEFRPVYQRGELIKGRGRMDFELLVNVGPDSDDALYWPDRLKVMDRRVIVYGYTLREAENEYIQHEVLDKGGRMLNAHKAHGLLDRCRHGKFISVFKRKRGCEMCRFEASPLHAYIVEKQNEKFYRESNRATMILHSFPEESYQEAMS